MGRPAPTIQALEASRQARGAKKRERKNTLATLLAGGCSLNEATKVLGVDISTVKRLFREIKADLGWQAQ